MLFFSSPSSNASARFASPPADAEEANTNGEKETATRATATATEAEGGGREEEEEGDTFEIVTPGKKVKAILAAFDSDSSDSDDNGASPSKRKPQNGNVKSNLVSNSGLRVEDSSDRLRRSTTDGSAEEEEGQEDDDNDATGKNDTRDNIEAPKDRRRMVSRMEDQGENNNGDEVSEDENEGKTETAYERLSRQLRESRKEKLQNDEQAGKQKADEKATNASDDDLPNSDLDLESPSSSRSGSPLFVPPAGQDDEPHNNNDDADDAQPPKGNPRFFALVARKRAEREEKEKEEAAKKASKATDLGQETTSMDDESEDGSEDEDGLGSDRKLGRKKGRKPGMKETRPRAPRKASKKALEEMNRETQRISRNMQLTHQETSKRKITKESFFARFNFMQPQQQEKKEQQPPGLGDTDAGEQIQQHSSSTGSQNSSDGEAGEARKDRETPHTSPMPDSDSDTDTSVKSPSSHPLPPSERLNWEEIDAEAEDILGHDELQKAPSPQPDPLVTESAKTQEQPAPAPKSKRKELTKPPVRVQLSRQLVAQHQNDDSDSDLEVVTSPSKARRIAAFENLPSKRNQEPAYWFKLKSLAHLNSPTRQNSSMSPAELNATLLHRARWQGERDKQERIQALRNKGIYVETPEERAAMEDQVEDLVEKARKEASDIGREERQKPKKLAQDDDDDDADFEFSGSEDEEGNGESEEEEGDGDEEGEGDEEESTNANKEKQGLVDDAASEDDESEDDKTEAALSDDDGSEAPKSPQKKRMDNAYDNAQSAPKTPIRPASQAPVSGGRSEPRPDLGDPHGSTMSLTQAFAGTLAENQESSARDPSAIPPSLPEPPTPQAFTGFHEPDSQVAVKDSQARAEQTPDLLAGYQSQDAPRVSESPAFNYSQIPDPTQDAGFVLSPFDPGKRFVGTPAPSTIDTLIVQQGNETPVATGQDRRSQNASVNKGAGPSAFDMMKKASKKKTGPQFDKNKSKAKDIVEEAAEESEDEYAGLGGASDEGEDSDGNEYDKEMINDNSGETVDEKELAALNAYVLFVLYELNNIGNKVVNIYG